MKVKEEETENGEDGENDKKEQGSRKQNMAIDIAL